MTLHTDIRSALEQRLTTLAGVPEIAWEDVAFDPTPGAAWLRVMLMPTATTVASIYQPLCMQDDGLFLIDVFTPDNFGPRPSDLLADVIRSHYRPSTILTAGSVSVRCITIRRDAGRSQPPWRVVPVSIGYRVVSPNG